MCSAQSTHHHYFGLIAPGPECPQFLCHHTWSGKSSLDYGCFESFKLIRDFTKIINPVLLADGSWNIQKWHDKERSDNPPSLPPWRGLAGGNGKFCIHTKICLKDPYLDISLLSGFKYHEIYTLLYAEHFEVYCFTDQGRFSIHSKNWLRNKLS